MRAPTRWTCLLALLVTLLASSASAADTGIIAALDPGAWGVSATASGDPCEPADHSRHGLIACGSMSGGLLFERAGHGISAPLPTARPLLILAAEFVAQGGLVLPFHPPKIPVRV